MSTELREWIQDPNTREMPEALLDQLITPDPDAKVDAGDQELEWLRTRSTANKLPDAAESSRLLAILLPTIEKQRAALKAWRTYQLDSARVIAQGGIMGNKMQSFREAMDARRIAPVAIEQLAQLEWASFLVFVHQVPLALAGLDMTTMNNVNHYVERVSNEQLDAMVSAMPVSDLNYFCDQQASPDALRRLLDSLLRQPRSSSSSAAPTADASLLGLIARCGTEHAATVRMREHLVKVLEEAQRCRSLRAMIGPAGDADPMSTQRADVLIEFTQRKLLPLLANATHLAEDAQAAIASVVVARMPADQLPE